MTALGAGGLLARAQGGGAPPWLLATTGVLAVLCASRLALALVNWFATVQVLPQPLPRLDFSKGIPPDSRTLAIVPTMLTSVQNVEGLVEALEVRFLANRDENLRFGLLGDLRDADAERLLEDDPLIALARQGIEELNRKYATGTGDAFFLFLRPHRWNARDRVWMGYERRNGVFSSFPQC